MTEELRGQLFELLTTKPVGKGKGMGLPISYQIIVENHGIQLLCFSALRQESEFVIIIPMRQEQQKPFST